MYILDFSGAAIVLTSHFIKWIADDNFLLYHCLPLLLPEKNQVCEDSDSLKRDLG